MRYKRPDKKNALSLIKAAQEEMKFTRSLRLQEEAGSTIVRNIYESFRMLGDALLVAKGFQSEDHIAPIRELLKIQVTTSRPIQLIDNLRQLRHNINYYGYRPDLVEVKDVISIAESCFDPLVKQILQKI